MYTTTHSPQPFTRKERVRQSHSFRCPKHRNPKQNTPCIDLLMSPFFLLSLLLPCFVVEHLNTHQFPLLCKPPLSHEPNLTLTPCKHRYVLVTILDSSHKHSKHTAHSIGLKLNLPQTLKDVAVELSSAPASSSVRSLNILPTKHTCTSWSVLSNML